MKLSIVIPAYNEEKRLPKTLEDIGKYLSKQTYDYEILVVSDGSTDKTAQITEKLKLKIKNLKLIDNKKNNGKGYVVKQGMLSAKGEYRLFTDADNSTSIEQIEKMWPEFVETSPDFTPCPASRGSAFKKGADMVIGSRDIKGAILDPPQPWLRQTILGEGFKLFRKLVIGLWKVEDTQCGFKCFTKKVAEDIFPKCKIDRFAFDAEILVIAEKLGYKIKEIPVHWKNDPESKVKFKSIIKMALDLFKIRWNSITRKYVS
ncbi:MAG TPA: dolichyl-phosphate beta-glucosyltransferase [Candidatus Humimicrobiaceae bacterium]|nr:dolichyl-phosphate beta-glucosyltransferase [Candidatus Humimicrobiaceae bacterium]